MARLIIAAVLVATGIAAPVRAESIDSWASYIAAASARCGVPIKWIERVMRAESGGRTMLDGRPIVSRAGAMGLMQLMPSTWGEMRRKLALGTDPHDPADNIMAGTCYLRLMYDRFGYPGLFGAYNAGPGRYAAWLAGQRPLPGETRAYLAAVAAGGTVRPVPGASARAPAPNAPPIFIVLRSAAAEQRDASRAGDKSMDYGRLFIIRR